MGWVYAAFRMNDLMSSLTGEQADDLDLEIYDDTVISEANRMFDSIGGAIATSSHSALSRVERIEIAGRIWTVTASALPAFVNRFDDGRPALILRGGVSFSLLVALIAWLLLDDRTRALQSAQQALHLALYDVLTGLPNRKLITERLGQALAKARREKAHVGLLFIDLDNFKPVNDDYGHAMGDLLLKDVARRLQGCMRETDTAARLGGDEFVVLLPSIEGRDGAMVVAAKVLHALSRPFEIAGNRFVISASIGIALYPEHGSDEKLLLRHADAAMYEAKKQGRNRMSFFDAGLRGR
jgi:diguanylate cyclase (GGDEF)-like protein